MQDPVYSARDKLVVYINKIDEYYDLTISKHDRDFINAYSLTMSKYKKQLVALKQQAEEAAGALLRDDKVSSLHRQIHWFKNEAAVLDQLNESQARDIKKFEMRVERQTEDRKFLKDQTKDAMKQNKILQVAL